MQAYERARVAKVSDSDRHLVVEMVQCAVPWAVEAVCLACATGLAVSRQEVVK